MFPRWLSLAFLAVLIYIGYSASPTAPSTPLRATTTPTITAENYPALVEITDVESWKRKLNPDYAATMNCTLDKPTQKNGLRFSAMEEVTGEGVGAVCGDTLTVALQVWDGKGVQVFSGDVALALGSRQVASGFDFGLLGMKPGGERLLVIPPYALVRGASVTGHDAVRKAMSPQTVSVVRVKRLK